MNKKSKKRILLTLGLLLALAVVLGIHFYPNVARFSASALPETTTAGQSEQTEAIADEEVPLAGDLAVPLAVAAPDPLDVEPAGDDPAEPEETAEPKAPEATPAPAKPADPDEPAEPEDPTDPDEPADPEEPADEEETSNTATRMLARATELLEQYYACATAEEKRVLLGASNYSLGNDALRAKLLSDMGGSWELLEQEVVDATEYQQDQTLYVQVYFGDLSSDYVPVVYTTKNSDLSGNQWSTNLIYDDDLESWMEYTQKHPYNDSRVGYYVTTLYNNEDGYEELKDVMETSDVWQEVVVADEDAGAADTPAPGDGAEG